mmetsp:Transcript_36610/g.66377  ORF Transcript_36610/g.66377 Transcript_36610/m.66377 type:complete len:345 (+) Transcript_36610:71-1105(+)|eukprot:CAMPEP_0197662408 /NCGR_PEP_ID=MMETSP1338-20131121/53283_1 /TAXON_ID=43686 ORGANISM="Pelagodinium beii, Strain RCC1491" /NCGR_SAMPLE_ID=MMETSP1338 /ASSEMBLY_ACC=CAM_ASM_000754 /LENGTH=344 /DNA_ID=CAMNT_0043240249 /DNA_START=51 /DNA_END=1085 /DNA_ORIENTATION=+
MCPTDTAIAKAQGHGKCILNIKSREADQFLKEAEIADEQKQILGPRFERYCETDADGELVLTLRGFLKLMRRLKACRKEDEENFFRTMCRDSNVLTFNDLVLGCAAAAPSTQHSVNSHTGRVRARYIFDFYDRSGSGTWDFEELSQMLSDATKIRKEPEEHLKTLVHWAGELGEVDVLTLRVHGSSGRLCEFRVSRRWCGSRIMREIARHLQVPQTGLKLQIQGKRFRENDILQDFVPRGDDAKVDVLYIDWDSSSTVEPIFSDSLLGLERLVHINFNRFMKVVEGMELSGTSRLFRFDRDLLRNRSGMTSRTTSAMPTPTGALCAEKSTMMRSSMAKYAYGGA